MLVRLTLDVAVKDGEALQDFARERVGPEHKLLAGPVTPDLIMEVLVLNSDSPAPTDYGLQIVRHQAGPAAQPVGGASLTAHLEVDVRITDAARLLQYARARYSECWADDEWMPETWGEAVVEALVLSNGNPSPDDYGIEIVECEDVDIVREPGDDVPEFPIQLADAPALVTYVTDLKASWDRETILVHCTACGSVGEIGTADLAGDADLVRCPECGVKAPLKRMLRAAMTPDHTDAEIDRLLDSLEGQSSTEAYAVADMLRTIKANNDPEMRKPEFLHGRLEELKGWADYAARELRCIGGMPALKPAAERKPARCEPPAGVNLPWFLQENPEWDQSVGKGYDRQRSQLEAFLMRAVSGGTMEELLQIARFVAQNTNAVPAEEYGEFAE